MDRKTTRPYVAAAKLPWETKEARTWRTRPDPLAEDWPAVTELLATTPGLQALTVLDLLTLKHPRHYDETPLRTLQRGVYGGARSMARRARSGSRSRTGEAAQTDFKSTAELSARRMSIWARDHRRHLLQGAAQRGGRGLGHLSADR
jgi:hypothetical protein